MRKLNDLRLQEFKIEFNKKNNLAVEISVAVDTQVQQETTLFSWRDVNLHQLL